MGVTARQAALAAGLVAAAVAAPSIRNDFVGDDRWVIVERPFLQHPGSVRALLAQPYWPPGFGGVLWRPAVLASYALDYRISHSPHWFHAVNVLWAGLAAALLALLACRVSDPPTGVVAGLLFAVHPVHVEATANVVGRAELMAAAGYAAALLCALLAERRRAWLIGVVLATGLAIGSKEHAATLPVAVLLVFPATRRSARSAVPAILASAAPIAIYFALRGGIAHGVVSAGGLALGLEGLNLAQRAWVMLPVSLEWWRLLLLPAHLSADYSPAEVVVTTAFGAGHALAVLVWGAAGWAAWRWRGRVPGALLGLAWVLLTVAPVSNVLVPTEILLAERTLFLVSWGAALALASVAVALPLSSRTRLGLLAAVLLLGAGRSVARVGAWHDDDAAFRAALVDAPRSYRTRWMLGKDEFAAGRWGSGERLLREAIAAAPQVAGPRVDLARFYAQAGRWRPAADLLVEATAVDSALEPAWQLLPVALLHAGDTVAAQRAAAEARRRFP